MSKPRVALPPPPGFALDSSPASFRGWFAGGEIAPVEPSLTGSTATAVPANAACAPATSASARRRRAAVVTTRDRTIVGTNIKLWGRDGELTVRALDPTRQSPSQRSVAPVHRHNNRCRAANRVAGGEASLD